MNTYTPAHSSQNEGEGPAIGLKSYGAPVNVDVWADIACPWCYIGKRRLETAARSFAAKGIGERRQVEIEFHSFELAPDLPLGSTQSAMSYNLNHLGMNKDQATTVLKRVTDLARAAGLQLNLDTARVTNTVLGHQLVHHAKTHDKQLEAEEALFAAYLTEGRNVSEITELAAIAEQIGLDRADTVRALTTDEHLPAVRADEALARSYGISGVPFMVVDDKYGLSGAQDPSVIERALETAWTEREATR